MGNAPDAEDIRNRRATFKAIYIYHPDPGEFLCRLYGDAVLQGRILDLTDCGEGNRKYAVIEVERGICAVVPVDRIIAVLELPEFGSGGTAAWFLMRLAMAVTYVDQVMAYLALSTNCTAFIDAISLAAFAGTSFTRRYGSNGFQVDSVSLDPPDDFRIQQLIQDDLRITGFSDTRSERHERKWIDYRIRKQQVIGWIDAAFTTQTSLALHAVPGSAVLGPQGTVEQAGTQSAPPPTTWRSNFLLALTTDQFSLSYPLQVNVFMAAAVSPTDVLAAFFALPA